jgi:hypothetical protein
LRDCVGLWKTAAEPASIMAYVEDRAISRQMRLQPADLLPLRPAASAIVTRLQTLH